jgi:cytoskeleton protein RodZ
MTDIGSTLREARMRARIDISEVEARTKIRAKYLRAMENEEFDLLPGPVYAKSFLRTYSDFLGLDSRMLIDEYKNRYEYRGDHEARPIAPMARDRERDRPRRRLPGWAPVAIAVVLLLGVLYVVGSATQSGSGSGSGHKPAASKPPAQKAPTHTAPPAPPKPTSVTLQLVPTGTVYVCLVDGSGKKLIDEQTYNSGQSVPVQKASKMLLTLGNNSVQMKVNGKAVPVGASANAIRFLLTPDSTKNIPLSQSPTCP